MVAAQWLLDGVGEKTKLRNLSETTSGELRERGEGGGMWRWTVVGLRASGPVVPGG